MAREISDESLLGSEITCQILELPSAVIHSNMVSEYERFAGTNRNLAGLNWGDRIREI